MGRRALVHLTLEVDSDPISGRLAVGAGAPAPFRGWMDLAAAIEAARSEPPASVHKTPGCLPGAEDPSF